MAFVVGLTGSIGSGKSTAAHCFAQLGVPVIDADNIAKELCLSGYPVFKEILNRFGSGILDLNGEINRKKLRTVIFRDPTERIWLEGILHPLIIIEILSWIKNLHADYCIVVAPLIFETSMKNYVDRILVIDTEEKKKIHRASLRDKLAKDDIKAVLNHQLSGIDKVKLANDVILNDGSLEELKEKVVKLAEFYLALAIKTDGSFK